MGVIIGGRMRKARIVRNVDPPVEGAFRGYWVGMGERRQSTVDASSIPRIKAFVHEIDWKAAQPTQADNTNGVIASAVLTALDNSITLANNNDLTIKIRVFSGIDSPDWAITLSGGITGWDPLDAGLGLQTIPKWFDTAFIDAYERFINALGTALSTRSTRIKEVTVAGATTVYSEPCIKQFANATNRSKAVAAGYTRAADLEALKRCMRIHHEAMSPHGICSSVAYNSWQEITDAGGMRTVLTTTFDLMQYQRTLMGRLGPWQNNSIGAYYDTNSGLIEARGGDYRTMYEYMKTEGSDKGHPVQFQTMTLAKMTGQYDPARPKPTVEYATQLGAISVEMPNGWDTDTYVTTAQADVLNNALVTNVSKLSGPVTTKTQPSGIVDDGAYATSAGNASAGVVRLPPTWAIADGVRECVWNVGLEHLVDANNAYVPGVIEAGLKPLTDYNAANPSTPLRVKIRLHAGERAPAHWDTACGTVEVADASFGKRAFVPRWWVTNYRTHYKTAMDSIASVVDQMEHVCAVTVPLNAFFYPEPLLLFPSNVLEGSITNGTNILNAHSGAVNQTAADAFKADHQAWLRWAASNAHTSFKRTAVAVGLNPAVYPNATGGTSATDTPFTIELAELFAATHPGMFIAENYSYRYNYLLANEPNTSSYGEMYAAFDRWITENRCRVGVQLARSHRVWLDLASETKVWHTAAQDAANRGWNFVETTGAAMNSNTLNAWSEAWELDRTSVVNIGTALKAN